MWTDLKFTFLNDIYLHNQYIYRKYMVEGCKLYCVEIVSITLTHWWCRLASLAPGRFKWKFRLVILKLILVIDGWCISCEIALGWMPLKLIDGKSTLIQIMLGTVRQQAMTWTSVNQDIRLHMVSLGHNELTHLPLQPHLCVGELGRHWFR